MGQFSQLHCRVRQSLDPDAPVEQCQKHRIRGVRPRSDIERHHSRAVVSIGAARVFVVDDQCGNETVRNGCVSYARTASHGHCAVVVDSSIYFYIFQILFNIFNKFDFVKALTYAIPAWVLGLIAAQVAAAFVTDALHSSTQIELSPLLSYTYDAKQTKKTLILS